MPLLGWGAKMNCKRALAATIAMAFAAGGCTTSVVTQADDIPGFHRPISEQIGDFVFVRSDMDTSAGFATAVCAADEARQLANAQAGLGAANASGPPELVTTAKSKLAEADDAMNAALHVDSNFNLKFSADEAPYKVSLDYAPPQAKSDPGKAQANADKPAADPAKKRADVKGKKTAVKAKTSDKKTVTAADASDQDAPPPSQPIHVSRCAMKVIATAVNVCIYRTLNLNALDEALHTGLAQVVGVAGTAAAIATLSRSSGHDTAWITGGAAIMAALAQGGHDNAPTPTAAQVSTIVQGGLNYIVLMNVPPTPDPKSNGFEDMSHKYQHDMRVEYGYLFDAAISQCALYGAKS